MSKPVKILNIALDLETHRALRIRAATNGMSMRKHAAEVLKRDAQPSNGKRREPQPA